MTWFALLTAALPLVAQMQPGRLTDVVQRVDAVHYYPQQHGLKDATAGALAPAVAAALAGGNLHARVEYVWKAPDRGRFEFTGLPGKGAGARRESLAALQSRGHYLFPPLMKEFIARFQVSCVVQNGLFRIEGLATDPKRSLRRFVFWVDAGGRFVRRLYETTARRELQTTIQYRSTPGGLLIAGFYATRVPVPRPEARGETGTAEPPADAVSSPPEKPRVIPFTDSSASVCRVALRYERVEEIYVPALLSEFPVRGAAVPFSLRLRDYRLNTGVEDAFFRGPGVTATWR